MITAESDAMIRTYELATKVAKELGISVAEFVRRAIRNALPLAGQEPWMKYAGFVESGNSNSSQSIDEIIYVRKD